jgi:hypothetical protein
MQCGVYSVIAFVTIPLYRQCMITRFMRYMFLHKIRTWKLCGLQTEVLFSFLVYSLMSYNCKEGHRNSW